jgi:hypothetical protein
VKFTYACKLKYCNLKLFKTNLVYSYCMISQVMYFHTSKHDSKKKALIANIISHVKVIEYKIILNYYVEYYEMSQELPKIQILWSYYILKDYKIIHITL